MFTTNNPQHRWMLHTESNCTPCCCMLLRVVWSCCSRFDTTARYSDPLQTPTTLAFSPSPTNVYHARFLIPSFSKLTLAWQASFSFPFKNQQHSLCSHFHVKRLQLPSKLLSSSYASYHLPSHYHTNLSSFKLLEYNHKH